MTWKNPTRAVAALRTKLAACPSWADYGEAAIHYPVAEDEYSLPLVVIQPDNAEATILRQRFESGIPGLPSGTLRLTLVMGSDAADVGTIETLAETLCRELVELPTGLIIGSPSHGTCGDPADGLVASGDGCRAIDITIPYGIGA